MPRYFQNMPVVGKPVRANAENVAELKAIEEEIHAQIVKGLENGKADDDYESTRFTATDSHTAVITSEYNMECVKEWLQRQTPISEMREF